MNATTVEARRGLFSTPRLGVVWRGLFTFVRRKPLGAISAAVIVVLGALALFAPFVTWNGPLDIDLLDKLKGPTLSHPFGTDDLGRDTYSRVVYGSQISLYVGFASVLVSTVIGSALGLVTGYYGGKADLLAQRIVDVIMAFPPLILALAIVAILKPNTNNSVVVISVVFVPLSARVVRGSVLSLKENVYVEAARAMGCSNTRVLLRHILPNVVAPIIVVASVLLGGAILFEASLSFLGAGTQIPTPSWGNMVSGTGRSNLETAPWLAIFPALFLSAAVFSFNLLGDAIRDILDPRLKGA